MSTDLYEAFEVLSDDCSIEQLAKMSTLQLISLQHEVNNILQQRLKALHSGIVAMNQLTPSEGAN